MTTSAKVLTWSGVVIALTLGIWIYVHFFFVFGEGVKAGELNRFVKKGWVFKTYEGRMIQSGYNSENTQGTIQSNEFEFSVAEKKVADELMLAAGKHVQLHYREYRGRLPWRGVSTFVVDSIVSVTNEERLTFPVY